MSDRRDVPPPSVVCGCACAAAFVVVIVCGGIAVGWRLLVWGGVVNG